MRLTLERRRWIWAYLFLAVPLVFFLWIRIGPTLFAFWMSLHQWDPIALDRPFIGLDNFRAILDDEVFWKAFRNTWVYVLVGVPAGLLFSLLVALGLQRLMHFVGFYRVLYFIPYITSLVAVGWVWRWMYTPNGLFNDVLSRLGLPQSGFLGDPATAIYAIIATTVWQGLGFQIVIFLAGLESIPGDYLDAASVDGATSWQSFRDIVLPLLNPTIVFLVITGVISNLQVFTQIRSMSSAGTGGPLDSTISVVLYVYQAAFQSLPSEMGYAAAMMVVLFVVILLITVLQLKFLTRGAYD
ncbi:MAG: sugar ABC transporter permease [Chloroflexia bacterium]|jgi:multiple sugar transport system permease protein|nr:sugar ABC transporter permease [Chloroflexia bacterium]MDQ3525350.1 sugar ABC transporter permease [Chloroflexota bacterium]